MSKGTKKSNPGDRHKNDSNVSNQILINPENLPLVQDEMSIKLKALINYEELPLIIKKRVKALKNFQLEVIKIEENFYRELSKLETAYAEKYQVIYDKRHEIVTGTREPTEQEGHYESYVIEELSGDLSSKSAIGSGDDKTEVIESPSEKGVPEFWLKSMQYSDIVRLHIYENDINVLKHLIDIKCVLNSGEENGFVLEFYFSDNEYFTDKILTKEYFVHVGALASCPFDYEGPEIVKAKGCTIHWCPGKNVTVKLVKKVQKSKKRSEKRTVTKVVKIESFFNFFDPPIESLNEEDISSDLENDFALGQFFRERLIPRAVLFYTGEGREDEFEDEEEEEDEENEGNEDDGGCCKGHDNKRAADGAIVDPQQKPECKQQ